MIKDGAMETELIAPLPALALGQVLDGKYRITRQLGGGAMGIVFEAYHPLLQKSVAIKVLRPEYAKSADLRDRFEAEARATAAIGHPNIVSVTDMGETPEGALYFVMDRLRGESLGQRLDSGGRMEVAAAATIALDVLAGLEAAHALRLVHRDLKPDNIFLSKPPAGREIAKILDFGIAKALASVGKRNMETRFGSTVGTPAYMAPEQAMGSVDIDGRADIWAVGVVLYQMLSGQLPYQSDDPMQILVAIVAGTPSPAPLDRLCPEAPIALVRLVESAMSREREKRPQTAGEFAAKMQEIFGGLTPVPLIKRKLTNPGLGASDFSALDAGVLTDLAGNTATPVPSDEPYESPYDEPRRAAPIVPKEVDVADLPPLTPISSPVGSLRGKVSRPAPPSPFPWRKVGQVARWAVPMVLVLAIGAVAAPKLQAVFASERKTAVQPATVDPGLVLMKFETTPAAKLYLDGSPLPTNPIGLGKGTLHTITAIADGHETYVEKFSVSDSRTLILKLDPKRLR
jgi:serine/threonine protein kinase